MTDKPDSSDKANESAKVTRRGFLATGVSLGAAALAGVSNPYIVRSAGALGLMGRSGTGAGSNTINVALIGCGEQGRVLLNAALKIPEIRFRAVCDIWDYNRTYGERLLKKFGHDPKPFEDYREMLAAVPDVDAVIVATPDWMHAEQTNASLRAGKHVYCEKLMANTIENARSMVRTARETGKLLQIGHQRRSNPRYIHAKNNLLGEAHLLGRITNINGQWNRAVSEDLGWPERYAMPQATLQKYGYASMHQFRNWRWFRKYSGGPISDLGAHQIDVYNWFLGVAPKSVMAGGGLDYYTNRDWYDNVMAIYEYPTAEGTVRAFYEVLTTTSGGGGYFEGFLGTEGALKMSENPAHTKLFREARAPEWDKWVDRGFVARPGSKLDAQGTNPAGVVPGGAPGMSGAPPVATVVDVRETAALASWEIPVAVDKAIHQPHLENFFDAIRKKAKLNCPAEAGFETVATVLKVNDAVAAKKMLTFNKQDFIA